MKRFFGLGVVLVLLYATLLTAIPTSAATAGPYNYTTGVIKNISVSTTKQLGGGKATYYKATVTSLMHNESSRQQSYSTHITVGTKNAKFFVYSAESSDKMGYSTKSVHDLALAFEKENPDWQVVAAVNGDFFNTSSGEPEGPMIQNYQMLKSFLLPDSEARGRGLVGVSEFTGKAVYHTIGSAYTNKGYGIAYKLSNMVQVLDSNSLAPTATYTANLANAPSATNVSFTTSDYGKGAYAGKTVYEVELTRYRNDKGRKNNSGNNTGYYFAEGKITKKITGTNDMQPSKGKAYIAVNSESQAPLLKVGAVVRCQKGLTGEWANVSNAIGFKQQLVAKGNLIFPGATYSRYHHSLQGGGDPERSGYYCSCGVKKGDTTLWTEDYYDYPMCWKQRTAIGFKEDGSCVLMVVGKSNEGSWGATYVELGTQFKALGCTEAFLLDGGGSSTMLIREGNSLNTVYHAENGSDGEGRNIANIAILAVLKDGKTSKFPTTDLSGGTASTNKATTATNKNNSTNKNNNKDTATDNLEAESVSDQASAAYTDVVSDGGCGSSLMFPALLATGGIATVGFAKKRKSKKEDNNDN